mgnify:FL=1
MSLAIHTIQANEDDRCFCCGRVHRKLYNVDGYWLGQNCADSYRVYKHNKDIKSIAWHGWEKKFEQVQRMVRGK